MSFRHSPPTVAVIGLGHQGLKHFQSLFQLEMEEEVKIVALVDIVQKDFTIKYPFFADYQYMLKQVQPDIVVICTPNFLHVDQTLAALKAGAYVFKEKPLALTKSEGKKLVTAAREAGRQIYTCQQRYHSFIWQTAAEQLKKLGPITNFSYSLTLDDEKYSWYWDEAQGGGAWINLGWHGLQVVEWLLGPISEIKLRQKRGGKRSWQYTTDHLSLAQVSLRNHAKGQIFVSSNYLNQEVLRVVGECGVLTLKDNNLHVRLDGKMSQEWHSPESKIEWYTEQLRTAIQAFTNDHDSMDLELRVLHQLEQGLLSSRKGKNVSS